MTDLNDVLRLEVDTSTPRNLIRNPSGADGLYGWEIGGCQVSTSNVPAAAHDNGVALVLVGGTTAMAYMVSQAVAVTPGRWVIARANYYAGGTVNTLQSDFMYYDVNGKLLREDTYAPVAVPQNVALETIRGPYQVPAAAVSMRVRWSAGGSGRGPMYVTKIAVAMGSTSASVAAAPYIAPNWVNILSPTYRISTEQGNDLDGVQDTITPGSFVANIRDASIDPATSNMLRKGRPVRLRAAIDGTTYPVWAGTIETADTNYDNEKDGTSTTRVTLTATDDGRAAIDSTVSYAPPGGFAAQVAHAAQAANLGTAGTDGASPAPGTGILARDDSAKAADWFRRACNTHGGYVWVDAANRIQQRLITYLSTAPAVTLSDRHADSGAIYYTGIGLNWGTRSLVNHLDVQRINVDEVEDDGAKTYGPYVASDSSIEYGDATATIEITSGSPSAIANVVLPQFATPKVFPTEVRLNALRDLARVLPIGPYTPVRVKRAGLYNDVVRVLKVKHDISPREWTTTLIPRPLETATTTPVTTPSAGADTGPSDLLAPEPGTFGSRGRTTTFSLASGAWTTVPLNVAEALDGGMAWDGTNSRFVVPKDGRYVVSAAVRFASNAAGLRGVRYGINGVQRELVTFPAGGQVSAFLSRTIKLTAGDNVSMLAYQSSGGALNIDGSTWLDLVYIGT